MDIRHRNLSGLTFDPQAEDFYGLHYKDYLFDGLLKKTEDCVGDKIWSVIYYKDGQEQDEEIIAMYAIQETVAAIYIRTRETYGSYRIESEHSYYKNEQTGQMERTLFLINWLYDVQDNLLAHEGFEIGSPSSPPQRISIKKYYYFGAPSPGIERPYFMSLFDEHNHFQYLNYMPDPEMDDDQDTVEYAGQDAITWMTLLGFPQKWLDWYTNNEFLPPPDSGAA